MLAKSGISGSWAAFSRTVSPSAKAAAIIKVLRARDRHHVGGDACATKSRRGQRPSEATM
jgi:hypothetical protein